MQIESRMDFGSLLISLNLNGCGIEIGVEKAAFSKILLTTSRLKKLYLLDPWMHMEPNEAKGMINIKQKWQDVIYKGVQKDMATYGDRIEIIKAKSCTGATMFPNDFFDFVYIDANHDYPHTKEDIELWYPKVKKGGLMAGHDYLNGSFRGVDYGVKRAVDEFCFGENLSPWVTKERKNKSWYFIRL